MILSEHRTIVNADDFLPIEDSYLPADLLHLNHIPRFVTYRIADLTPTSAPMTSDDFAEHLSKRKKPAEPRWTAVEINSGLPVGEEPTESWMSFQDATSAAAAAGAYVGFRYANFGYVPQESLDEITLPVELVIAANAKKRLIMPVAPQSKRPNLTSFIYGATPASSDLIQIRRQAALFPGCDWGERTGAIAGFIGLDIDSEDGQKWLESKPVLPVTEVVKTGSPKPFKKHYKLALPPGMEIKGSTGKLAPGVDIRGYNNILVIAPSKHKSGGRYRVEVEAPLALIPGWLVAELRALGHVEDAITPRKERSVSSTFVPAELGDEEYEYALRNYRKQITNALAECDQYSMEDAPWNNKLNLIAGTAGSLYSAGVCDEDHLKSIVEDECADYVDDNRSGFNGTWKSGFTHGQKSPWESPWSVAAANRIFRKSGFTELPAGAFPTLELLEHHQKTQSDAIVEKLDAERAATKTMPEVAPDGQQDAFQFPEGLVGDVARFIYKSAYKPNREVALAGAIAFLAGIAGRQYNTSTGTGLNQYLIVLAETSRGKEGAATGIGKLRRAINLIDLTLMKQFVGPGSIASAPALKKRLSGSACFYSFMGEIGKTLQKMTARNANPNDIDLMGCLMDAFMKSGRDSSMPGSDYASKENIPDIDSPCATVIGDSTPGDFYKAITLSDFSSGLIPRFTIIEHAGPIPPSNEHHKGTIPAPELVQRLVKLIRNVIKLQPGHKVIEVDMTPEARLFSKKFEYDYERKQEQNAGPIAELWSRSNLRMLRLASLVAVGALPWHDEHADFTCVIPTVTLPMIEWAAALIVRSNQIVERRVENGSIGQTGEAAEQRRAIESCIRAFVTAPKYKASWYSSGITEEMHKAGQISYRYIQNFTKNKKCFTSQDYGKSADAILRTLVDSDSIRELRVTNSKNGMVSKQFQVLTVDGLHEGD